MSKVRSAKGGVWRSAWTKCTRSGRPSGYRCRKAWQVDAGAEVDGEDLKAQPGAHDGLTSVAASRVEDEPAVQLLGRNLERRHEEVLHSGIEIDAPGPVAELVMLPLQAEVLARARIAAGENRGIVAAAAHPAFQVHCHVGSQREPMVLKCVRQHSRDPTHHGEPVAVAVKKPLTDLFGPVSREREGLWLQLREAFRAPEQVKQSRVHGAGIVAGAPEAIPPSCHFDGGV